MPRPKPVMLMILDGWGIRQADQANAVTLARTPNLDGLAADYSFTQLRT
jgi:2,3-bisphosphoglycerate-independent phosphoglycerate mutase